MKYFQEFYGIDGNLDQVQVIDQIRHDLEIHSLTGPDVMVNYNIFKCIRAFLKEYKIAIPPRVNGKNMIVVRILSAIWPLEEDQIQEAIRTYRLFSGYRTENRQPHPMNNRLQESAHPTLPTSSNFLNSQLISLPTASQPPSLPTSIPPVSSQSYSFPNKHTAEQIISQTQPTPHRSITFGDQRVQPFAHTTQPLSSQQGNLYRTYQTPFAQHNPNRATLQQPARAAQPQLV